MARAIAFIRTGAVAGVVGLANGLYFVAGSWGRDAHMGWSWCAILPIGFGLAGALAGVLVAALTRWLLDP